MSQQQANGVVVAQPQDGKVALPMKSVRKVIEDLPDLDLGQIEEMAGCLLSHEFALERRAETNVVGAIIAAVKRFSEKGVNLAGAKKEERLAALYGFSLIRLRVRELFATRKNQTEGGTFLFNFPLFMGHPMCGVLQETLDNAHLAYPEGVTMKTPPFKIRFIGVAPGMGGGHSPKLLAQAEARKETSVAATGSKT